MHLNASLNAHITSCCHVYNGYGEINKDFLIQQAREVGMNNRTKNIIHLAQTNHLALMCLA